MSRKIAARRSVASSGGRGDEGVNKRARWEAQLPHGETMRGDAER